MYLANGKCVGKTSTQIATVEKFGWVWPEEQIGVVKAERDEHDRHIVVASMQTLQHKRRRDRLRPDGFSLVIADEDTYGGGGQSPLRENLFVPRASPAWHALTHLPPEERLPGGERGIFYQRSAVAPQVSPAPNATIKMTWPFCTRPAL